MRTTRFAWFSALFVSAAAAATAPGCGSSSNGDGFSDPDAALDGASDSLSDQAIGEQCPTGTACGDGGVCAGNTCCAHEHVCGTSCCGGADICSFLKCVTPGAACVDSSDCPSDQYCDYQLGTGDAGVPPTVDASSCVGGAPQNSGRCIPRPPICAPDAGTGGVSCLDKCEYKVTGAFTPELKYYWGG